MADAALIIAAFVFGYVGLALLALRQRSHWLAVMALPRRARLAPVHRSRMSYAGAALLAASLGLSWQCRGQSFGSLLWLFVLGVSGVGVTFTLAWRRRWLRLLVRGVGASKAPHKSI